MESELTYRRARVMRHLNTRFLMIHKEKQYWMNFVRFYRELSNGVMEDGGLAIDVNGSGIERPLTRQEKNDITNASNEYSGDK